MMELHTYPTEIAKAATLINDLDFQLGKIKRNINNLEAQADAQVANDQALKNDSQRKAERFFILSGRSDYQGLLDDLAQLSNQKTRAIIELERLRNEFDIAKLEVRHQIVRFCQYCSSESDCLIAKLEVRQQITERLAGLDQELAGL